MSVTLQVEKNLICEQDVLIGRQAVEQKRGGTTIVANPFRLLKIVESFGDLKTVDVNKYDVAFYRYEFPMEDLEEAPPIPPGANDFYLFDPNSTQEENLPDIIVPGETTVGRWKRILVGESKTIDIIDTQIEKSLEAMREFVENSVNGAVEVLVPQEIQKAINTIYVKGFEFKDQEELVYKELDYVKVFVKSRNVITERLYMITKDQTELDRTPLKLGPLSGNKFKDKNGTIIYIDDDSLRENPDYSRVYTLQNFIKTVSVRANSNYKIFEPSGGIQPEGVIKCRVKKGASTTAYFEIVFGGISHKDFTIRNVQYSKAIRASQVTSANGLIYYPGFAVTAGDSSFEFSVHTDTYCDKLEIDFGECSQQPLGTPVAYNKDRCYAIREDGGSYIKGLGDVIPSTKLASNGSNGDCKEFFLFMNGYQFWSTNIRIDSTLYHQYHEGGFASTDVDVSDAYIRTKGSDAGTSIGKIGAESLPNIKGKMPAYSHTLQSFAYAHTIFPWACNWTSSPISDYKNGIKDEGAFELYVTEQSELTNGSTYFRGIAGSAQDLTSKALNVAFKASKSSKVYKDGAKVNTKHVVLHYLVQLF